MLPVRLIPLAALFVVATAAAPAPVMLPDRTLECTLGRMTNVDPKKDQRDSDIVYDGQHRFVLHLPSIPARTAPPPDAIETPEPVAPGTRIVEDPDGLTAGFPNRFDRVVDYWPQRTELATTIDDPLVNFMVINPIDEKAGTAMLFMTRATDVATYDLAHVYRGPCKVVTKDMGMRAGG